MGTLAVTHQITLDNDQLVEGPIPVANPEGDGICPEALKMLDELVKRGVITIQQQIDMQTRLAFIRSKTKYVEQEVDSGTGKQRFKMEHRAGFDEPQPVMIPPEPDLVFVQRAGDGMDNADPAGMARHGVVADNSPGHNAPYVAKTMLTHFLSLVHRLQQNKRMFVDGHYPTKETCAPLGLRGKQIHIVGMGKVGQSLLSMLTPLPGCSNISFNDPGVDNIDGARKLWSLDQALETADWIFVCVSVKSGDKAILGPDEFEKLRPTCGVINGARGICVDEYSAYQHILRGGMVGLEVQEVEGEERFKQVDKDYIPLFDAHPNVSFTGHMASKGPDSEYDNGIDSANRAIAMITHGDINTVPDRSHCAWKPKEFPLEDRGVRAWISHADIPDMLETFIAASRGSPHGIGEFDNTRTTRNIYSVGEAVASGLVENGEALMGSRRIDDDANRRGVVTCFDLKGATIFNAQQQIRNLLDLTGGVCRVWLRQIEEVSG